MFRLLVAALVLVILSAPGYAGGRGGHSTTFDPNSYGGGWKNFIADFGATCNGVASDDTALASWAAYGVGLGAAQAKLYIPPGSKCVFSSGFLACDNSTGTSASGIQNAIVWGYGATATNLRNGCYTFYDDNQHSARVATVNSGATAVTLVNSGDASKFAVGNWIAIAGLSLQIGSFPLNFQLIEYKRINGIVGSVVSLSTPLTFTYLSTWPVIAPNDTSQDYGGPATIYLMVPSFDTNLTVFGLSSTTPGNEVTMNGRTVIVYDANYVGCSPSAGSSIWLFNVNCAGTEIDKDIENLYLVRSAAHNNWTMQSASVINFWCQQCTGNFSGTVQNTYISGGSGNVSIGPSGYGVAQSLTVNGSVVPAAVNVAFGPGVPTTDFSFSSGVLSIANNSANIYKAYAWGIPGHSYYFGDTDGSNNSSPQTHFTISAVTQDATNSYFTLSSCSWGSCAGSLPTPTCGANPSCANYIPYGAQAITQDRFTGPANLTQFQAP
jgi:hypothetical protein